MITCFSGVLKRDILPNNVKSINAEEPHLFAQSLEIVINWIY